MTNIYPLNHSLTFWVAGCWYSCPQIWKTKTKNLSPLVILGLVSIHLSIVSTVIFFSWRTLFCLHPLGRSCGLCGSWPAGPVWSSLCPCGLGYERSGCSCRWWTDPADVWADPVCPGTAHPPCVCSWRRPHWQRGPALCSRSSGPPWSPLPASPAAGPPCCSLQLCALVWSWWLQLGLCLMGRIHFHVTPWTPMTRISWSCGHLLTGKGESPYNLMFVYSVHLLVMAVNWISLLDLSVINNLLVVLLI